MKTNIYLAILYIFFIVSCKEKAGDEYKDTGDELLGRIIDSANIITMDKFIGANAFVDDPVDKLKAVGFIREYHNWSWDEGNGDPNYPGFPQNQIQFSPSGPGWSYDEFYTNCKNEHIEIAPCLQGSVSWLHGKNDFPTDDKPTDNPGLDTRDPYSYFKKSHYMYQVAARYGSTKVPDERLTLAPNQEKKSGLGLIRYLEDWNEQDKGWKGKNAEFSPEEYAAMASADYDGHCNTMNKFSRTYGVKNADPNIKMVMGGLATLSVDYIKKMKDWFEANRSDKKFAADVINFHIYAFKKGTTWKGGGPAISPEDAHFREKLAEAISYRNKFLPGAEVWVSEFGWDTNIESPLRPPLIGNFDMQDMQAIWLVRAYLAFAAAGVDRAQMYMSRDVDPNDKTWYASCGLMGPKGDFTPKKSWYYIATLKNTLQDMVYIGRQKTKDPNILIYKFKDIHSTKGVYAVWAKTSKDYKIDNYPLDISKNATTAEQISMVPGNDTGDRSRLAIKNGNVFLNISEKPVFIMADHID